MKGRWHDRRPGLILHAGLIARRARGAWGGVLILGPSGAGKSDLALRAMDEGFRLVADDRTLLFLSQGVLFGRAPAPLRGLIEARGVGVLDLGALPFAPVRLAVRCVMTPGEVERMPEGPGERLMGLESPALELWAPESSAPAKIRRAIEHLGAHP